MASPTNKRFLPRTTRKDNKMKLFEFNNNTWLFVIVLLAVFAVSSGVRYQQFETWKKNPGAYFVGERPMMTTLDAPYWLRIAREYNAVGYRENKRIRSYPEGNLRFLSGGVFVPTKYQDPPPDAHVGLASSVSSSSSSTNNISSTASLSSFETLETETSFANRFAIGHLLSFLIAKIVPYFNYNYYLAGTLLVPLLASLFILPLGIYFFRIGVPLAGLLGGLIGTFASGYYMRSSIGRIDTDMLNLFFPVLAALLILLTLQSKSERSVLLYSAAVGISLLLFEWWYSKPGFSLVYFVVLIFSLFIHKIRFRTVLLSAFLFTLCVHPTNFTKGTNSVESFLKGYLSIEETKEVQINNGTTPGNFPNTMTTISEVDKVAMDEVLRRVLSNTILDWTGLLFLFGMAVFKWRVLLPMLPMLALGLLSFQSSNRFIMYLGPFIGIGLGWLLQLVVERVFLLITKNIYHRDVVGTEGKGKKLKAKGSLWAKISAWLLMDFYANGRAPKGTKNAKINQQIAAKEGANKIYNRDTEDSKVDWWNWIRQGTLYLVMCVFFWLISGQTAISFVPGPSIHPRLYATFLEVKKRVPEDSALLTWWDYGYAIADATGLATFHDGGSQQGPKTYFIARGLISHDQDELYDITQYLSTEGTRGIGENNTSPEDLLVAVRNPQQKPWNPIYLFFTADMTGKYGAISKLGSWDIVNGGSKPRGYINLACNKITNEEINCRGAKIDLNAGKINNRVALKRLVFIRDGQVLREQKFGHAQGYSLQLLVAGQRVVEVQLIDEVVFRSNYNQMFLLGRYRDDLYEEAYNAFPFSRLFKVKF